MSECVVRMEMPKDCFECPFGIIDYTEDGVWCNALAQQSSGQREDCPIVCSLPERHGRLVDMNDVEGMFESAQIISDDDCNCGYVTDDLRLEELPTIVPADTAERSEHV